MVPKGKIAAFVQSLGETVLAMFLSCPPYALGFIA
jgi:hypothetical protein